MHTPLKIPTSAGQMAARSYGDPTSPPLILCHANGFCGSTYRQLSVALAKRYFVLAVDLRGHGRSDLPTNPKAHRSYQVYARDLHEFADGARAMFGLSGDWVFAGHSMGAVSCLLCAADRSDVRAVRLVEPVLLPAGFRVVASMPLMRPLMDRWPMVRGAKNRRNVWPDRKSVFDSYLEKPLFRHWAPGVLDDYLEDGLVETDEGVRLACAPAWEAANFAAQGHNAFAAIRRLAVPLSVMTASRHSTVVPSARARVRRLGGQIVQINASHLAPMEEPGEVTSFLAG